MKIDKLCCPLSVLPVRYTQLQVSWYGTLCTAVVGTVRPLTGSRRICQAILYLFQKRLPCWKYVVYRSVMLRHNIYWLSFWCRIHLWFRLMGGLQTKSMTSQRNRVIHKMADMRYYGNVMTTTKWRLFYIFNSTVIDWTCFFYFHVWRVFSFGGIFF